MADPVIDAWYQFPGGDVRLCISVPARTPDAEIQHQIPPDCQVVETSWPSFAWPGGYELHYYTQDGGVLCHQCANKEWARTHDGDPESDAQFYIIGMGVHWEGPPLTCDHCNREIPSEYGDPDENP